MSVIQQTQDELRFLKRRNLEEESRLIGNNLRDQIRSYGIDCIYRKLDLSEFDDFKGVADMNAVLKHAYGYNDAPDYNVSAHMITYCEFQTDIFQLNKYGLNPNVEVEFNFDRTDFACALAPKVGQLKEYPIEEREFVCEVPECTGEYVENNGKKYYLSAFQFPYELGYEHRLQYTSRNLSGYFRAMIPAYEIDEETGESDEVTIMCDPYEHTDFGVDFPANGDLYRSMKYVIENDDYLETLIYLTYRIRKIKKAEGFKYVLSGRLHGSLLFFDVNRLGKYLEIIHPMIGDLVEIDFPDENNREIYEITECFDKQLTNDGISPLLHKYIWKCKARRYMNSYEPGAPVNEADARLDEKTKFDQIVDGEVSEKISLYNDLSAASGVKEDAVYGGYEGTKTEYDHNAADMDNSKFDYVEAGQMLDIFKFGTGSKLCTNGLNLTFVDAFGRQTDVSVNKMKDISADMVVEKNARWLKATDSAIVFVNSQNESCEIICDFEASSSEVEICLNDLNVKTIDPGQINEDGTDNFYKFKGTRSYLYATDRNLFAKLASNRELYKIC